MDEPADHVAAGKDSDDENEKGGDLLVSFLTAAPLLTSLPRILNGDVKIYEDLSVGIHVEWGAHNITISWLGHLVPMKW